MLRPSRSLRRCAQFIYDARREDQRRFAAGQRPGVRRRRAGDGWSFPVSRLRTDQPVGARGKTNIPVQVSQTVREVIFNLLFKTKYMQRLTNT